jgi:hypothetical protein
MIFQLNDEEIKSLFLAVRERGLSEGKSIEKVLTDIIYGKDVRLVLKGLRIYYAVTMADVIDEDFLFSEDYEDDEPTEIIHFPSTDE